MKHKEFCMNFIMDSQEDTIVVQLLQQKYCKLGTIILPYFRIHSKYLRNMINVVGMWEKEENLQCLLSLWLLRSLSNNGVLTSLGL